MYVLISFTYPAKDDDTEARLFQEIGRLHGLNTTHILGIDLQRKQVDG